VLEPFFYVEVLLSKIYNGYLCYSDDDVKAGWQISSPSSSLVTGTVCSPKDIPEKNTDELNRRSARNNNAAQQEDVPQQRDQRNLEASLKAANLDMKILTPANDRPQFHNTGTIDPQQQGEAVYHMTGPSNVPADDIISDLSNKSKSAQSKQPHSSTISTGMNIIIILS